MSYNPHMQHHQHQGGVGNGQMGSYYSNQYGQQQQPGHMGHGGHGGGYAPHGAPPPHMGNPPPPSRSTPQNPFDKQSIKLSHLSDERVGIDGNWFLAVIRSAMKKEDPLFLLNGPISPKFTHLVLEFVKCLTNAKITPVFVFDGLFTVRQGHPPTFMHGLDRNVADVKEHVKSREQLGDDVGPYVIRLLSRQGYEVMTAPYLAWAQLVYLGTAGSSSAGGEGKPYISEVFGPPELLCFDHFQRVIHDVGDWVHNGITCSALKCPNSSDIKEKAFKYVLHDSLLKKSVYWSYNPSFSPEDASIIRNTMEYCPVLTLDGKVDSLQKALGKHSIANLADLFHKNLNAESPMVYYLLATNVISPTLLNVVSSEAFVDDPPLIRSGQFNSTLECIIPLRTQIVCQLIQDLQNLIVYLSQLMQLTWKRSSDNSSIPIQRPPKITLDEWDGLPKDVEQNFTSVLKYATKATQHDVAYLTPKQGRAAVLLKSLDLLGYFTHAAHSVTLEEESSMSIFAEALGKMGDGYGEQGVLLIELTRTRSLTDMSLEVEICPELRPVDEVPVGARFAARVLSLLQLKPDKTATEYSIDILAFNDIARAFHRNLRLLSEAIAASQVITSTARYGVERMRDFCYKLPFSDPLTCHAGVLAEFILTSNEFLRSSDRLATVQTKFAYLGGPEEVNEVLLKMKAFWGAANKVFVDLINDEEADHEFIEGLRESIQNSNALLEKTLMPLV